jgi:hypothetical protein
MGAKRMIQIKIFFGYDIEKQINLFMEKNDVKGIVDLKRHYYEDHYEDGHVCNRIMETILVYKI